MNDANNPFSAASSVLGYLFQCRFALLDSLRKLRKSETFIVLIETLDDVVFEVEGKALELLQTKHHINKAADLTDASPDLWKTIRIWCEGLSKNSIPDGSFFYLITTGEAPEGSAAYYLKAGDKRNVAKALERLNATIESSTSQTNAKAYNAFRGLNLELRTKLINAMIVVDGSPTITDLEVALKEEIFFAVEQQFIDSFLQRLEGWWFRRAINHLVGSNSKPILSEELIAETTRLREQFKQDSLPIDDEIMRASVDASGYQDRAFVYQLRLIEIGNPRIFHAIRNYFRAFEQRSRWIREDLLLVGELERYEDRLVEEWDILFQQMRDELGENATEEAKKKAAQTLYKWVETATHPSIRTGVTEPSIARGTYQILSDDQRVGWHLEFRERLQQLLELQEAER